MLVESLPIKRLVPPNKFPLILPVLFIALPTTYKAPVFVKAPGIIKALATLKLPELLKAPTVPIDPFKPNVKVPVLLMLLPEFVLRAAVIFVVPLLTIAASLVTALLIFRIPVPLVVIIPEPVFVKPLGTVKLPLESTLIVPVLLEVLSGVNVDVTFVIPLFVTIPLRGFATFNCPVPVVVILPAVFVKLAGIVKLPPLFTLIVPVLLEVLAGVNDDVTFVVPPLVTIPLNGFATVNNPVPAVVI